MKIKFKPTHFVSHFFLDTPMMTHISCVKGKRTKFYETRYLSIFTLHSHLHSHPLHKWIWICYLIWYNLMVLINTSTDLIDFIFILCSKTAFSSKQLIWSVIYFISTYSTVLSFILWYFTFPTGVGMLLMTQRQCSFYKIQKSPTYLLS